MSAVLEKKKVNNVALALNLTTSNKLLSVLTFIEPNSSIAQFLFLIY